MADKQNRGSHKTEEMHFLYTQTEILKKKKNHKTPKYVVFIKIQKKIKKSIFWMWAKKKAQFF